MAGRLILLSSVINAIPNYHFQSFLAPKSIIDEYDKLRNSFMSNHNRGDHKLHHFSMDLAMKSKAQGHLDLKILWHMTIVFLAKKFSRLLYGSFLHEFRMKSKAHVDLGLKNLRHMNIAFLTKKFLRLLLNRYSLLFQVFKGKYLKPNEHILHAIFKQGQYWGWKGIFEVGLLVK